MPPPDRSMLEWHRVSVLGRLVFLWLMAVGFIMAGMVGTGLHLFAPPTIPEDTRWLAGLLGWPSAVLGPVVGIMGILRVLAGEDRALVVCRQELRLEGFGAHAPIPWRDLHGMHLEGRWPKRVLVLIVQRDGRETRIPLPAQWVGLSGERLCARVLEIRRRALLGVPERLP